MAQPTDKTRWATDGGADITDPSSGQRDIGWADGDDVDAGIFNSLLHNYYEWFQYLKNLTAEVLTWTAKQTFEGQDSASATPDEPAEFLGGAYTGGGSNAGGPAATFTGGDTTGALGGPGSTFVGGEAASGVGGRGIDVTGGAGLNGGRGGRFFGGAASAGTGGEGVTSTGGAGDTGGEGGVFFGGASNDIATDGPAGAYAIGGSGGNDVHGPGYLGEGLDSDVSPGQGGVFRSGDVTTAGGTATEGLLVEQGNTYTDGTKTTFALPGVGSKAAITINPGIRRNGGINYSNNGIRVANKASVNGGSFEVSQFGVSLDDGLFIKMDALDTGAYAAGTNFSTFIQQGILSPFGFVSAACRVRYSNSGGTGTVAFESTSDRFNVGSLTYVGGSNSFTVNFANPFLGTSTYFVAMTPMDISGTSPGKYRPYLSAHAASGFSVRMYDAVADLQVVDLDAGVSSGTTIVFDFMVFGR